MSAHVTRYRVVPCVEGDHPITFLGFPKTLPRYRDMRGFAWRLLLALHLAQMERPILTCGDEQLLNLARDFGVLPKRMSTFYRGIALLITRGYLVPLDGAEDTP